MAVAESLPFPGNFAIEEHKIIQNHAVVVGQGKLLPVQTVQVMSITRKEIKPPVIVSSVIRVKERGLKIRYDLLTDQIIPCSLSITVCLYFQSYSYLNTHKHCPWIREGSVLKWEEHTNTRPGQQLVEEMLPTWNMTQHTAADLHGGWRVSISAAITNAGIGLMSSLIMADSLGGEWPQVITEK